jgi:hypothetical protein
MHIPGISAIAVDGHTATTASSLAMTSFGIPLTASMSAGFTNATNDTDISFLFSDNIALTFL